MIVPQIEGENVSETGKAVHDGRIDLKQGSAHALTDDLSAPVDPEIAQRVEKIKSAKTIVEQVEAYGKGVEKYGVKKIARWLPFVGDEGMALGNTFFLMYQAEKMNLSRRKQLKIRTYQAIDLVGNTFGMKDETMRDRFGFDAHEKSLAVFEEKYQKILQQARKDGVDEKIIAEINQEKDTFISNIGTYIKGGLGKL